MLLLPDGKPPVLPPETALLAWNGERECARALKAAMPLLSKVKNIDVVSINREGDDAKAIALHINRHGFKTNVHVLEDSHLDNGDILLRQADELNSQMIIMGAYGHSRIRELMLGGTTRHVLEQAELPVLFSH